MATCPHGWTLGYDAYCCQPELDLIDEHRTGIHVGFTNPDCPLCRERRTGS